MLSTMGFAPSLPAGLCVMILVSNPPTCQADRKLEHNDSQKFNAQQRSRSGVKGPAWVTFECRFSHPLPDTCLDADSRATATAKRKGVDMFESVCNPVRLVRSIQELPSCFSVTAQATCKPRTIVPLSRQATLTFLVAFRYYCLCARD